MKYPCSNTACPHDGRVEKQGQMCEGCRRREREVQAWIDKHAENKEQYDRHHKKGQK